MSRFGELVKGSLILIISNLTLKAISFFLLPLYTHFLTPDLLGITDTIANFASLLFTILVMALDSAFGAFFYDVDGAEHQTKVFNTVWWVLLGASVIPFLLMLLAPVVSNIFFKTDAYAPAICVSLGYVSVNLWYLPFSLKIRLQNRMTLFALISISASLCMIACNIVFLSVLDLGYYALLYSTLVTHALQLLLYIIFSKTKISLKLSEKTLLKKMMRFSIPLIPLTLSNWIITMSDRYILLFSGYSEADVGLYGVAARFLLIMTVIMAAVFKAYPAYAFRSYNEGTAKEEFPKVLNGFFLLLAGICFAVSLFGKEIVEMMTAPAYHSAYTLLPAIMFSQLAYGVSIIVGYGITFSKKTIYSTISVSSGAVFNIVTNIIFIPRFGLGAAVITTLISYCFICVLYYIFSQRFYPCNYQAVKIVIVFTVLLFISMFTMELEIFIKIGIFLVCAAASLWVFRKDAAQMIRLMRKKQLRNKDSL